MPGTPNSVVRTNDSSGDNFKVWDTPEFKVQAVASDPTVTGSVLSWVQTAGAAQNQLQVKASAGAVFSAEVVVSAAVVDPRWLMVFDTNAAVVLGAVPVLRKRLVGGEASIPLAAYGRNMTTGIYVAISSTVNTLTLPGGAEGYFQVSYI